MAFNASEVEERVSNMVPADMRDKMYELRERFGDFDVNVRNVVRERPFLTICGALLSGYFLARLFSR